jgi:hypothetical protein
MVILDNLGVIFKNNAERREFMQDRVNNHARLQREINVPFIIDYSVFEKSSDEKFRLRIMKKKWFSTRTMM